MRKKLKNQNPFDFHDNKKCKTKKITTNELRSKFIKKIKNREGRRIQPRSALGFCEDREVGPEDRRQG